MIRSWKSEAGSFFEQKPAQGTKVFFKANMQHGLHKLMPILAGAAALLATGSAAATEAVAPAGTAADAPATARFLQILETARTQHALDLADPAADRKLSEALLHAIGGGARLSPATADRQTAGDGDGELETVRLNTHALYVEVPRISAGLPAEFNRIRDSIRNTKESRGWILDLRYAAGGTVADANQAGAFFSRAESTGGGVPAPVVLIGPETTGAAEFLAGILRSRAGAVLVGQPTAGRFTELRPFKTAGGEEYWLPVPVPPESAGLPSGALKPDIAVTADRYPSHDQIRGVTQERFRNLPDRDPALRRAVDLVCTIAALQPKRYP